MSVFVCFSTYICLSVFLSPSLSIYLSDLDEDTTQSPKDIIISQKLSVLSEAPVRPCCDSICVSQFIVRKCKVYLVFLSPSLFCLSVSPLSLSLSLYIYLSLSLSAFFSPSPHCAPYVSLSLPLSFYLSSDSFLKMYNHDYSQENFYLITCLSQRLVVHNGQCKITLNTSFFPRGRNRYLYSLSNAETNKSLLTLLV